MANIASNPWSLTSADVVVSTPNAITLNADGTVSVTTAAAHNLVAGNGATLIGVTPAAYNGFYFVLAAPTGTTLTLVPQFSIAAGTGVGTVFGTLAKCLYNAQIRVEDISWQSPGTIGDLLDLRDRMGNIVWQCKAASVNGQNRGKVFWINGLSPVAVTSGIVLITVN